MLTPQMEEIIDWWEEYGIKNWETDDVRPPFDELLHRMCKLPAHEDGQYLLTYLSERNYLLTTIGKTWRF